MLKKLSVRKHRDHFWYQKGSQKCLQKRSKSVSEGVRVFARLPDGFLKRFWCKIGAEIEQKSFAKARHAQKAKTLNFDDLTMDFKVFRLKKQAKRTRNQTETAGKLNRKLDCENV